MNWLRCPLDAARWVVLGVVIGGCSSDDARHQQRTPPPTASWIRPSQVPTASASSRPVSTARSIPDSSDRMEEVCFERDSALLAPSEIAYLRRFSAVFRTNESRGVILIGRSTDDESVGVAAERAASVRQFLVESEGIAPERISVTVAPSAAAGAWERCVDLVSRPAH